jgi:hypothetical protein
MKRHLDSEYSDRWEEFYLSDGTVEDSRQKNWRDVAWDKVIRVEAHLNGHTHMVDDSGPGFLAFMNFRWGGSKAIYDKGKYVGHKPINIWVIGWTDGRNCFQKNIDFYSGELISERVDPIRNFVGHIHPAVADEILNGNHLESIR